MVSPRASMLDDERYPIAVNTDQFAESVIQPDQVPLPQSAVSSLSQHPSYVINNTKLGNVQYSESFVAHSPVSEISSSRPSYLSTANSSPLSLKLEKSSPWNAPAFDSELLRPPQQSISIWKQFNVIKVLIFGFAAFVTGVVIAVIVLNSHVRSPHPKTVMAGNKTAETTAAGTTAAGTTAAGNTITMNATIVNTATASNFSTTVSMASSGLYLEDGVTWNMQVYYQLENTTSIMYRMSLTNASAGREMFEKARNMSLLVAPKVGSPMTATASTDDTRVVYLDIFYLTAQNGIAQASLSCPANSADCRTISNSVISIGAQALHPESSLAAVNVDHAQDWRIYYQNTNSNIVELAGNTSGFNQGVTIYNGNTLAGSALTAVNVDVTQNNINVFFVDDSSSALFYTQFTDSWQTALPVTTAVVENWNPTSSLASAYDPTPNQIRLYYVGTNSKISEYTGSNATSIKKTWLAQPGTNEKWLASTDSIQQITAQAFKNQVRWWQYDSAGLVEAALNGTTWVENRVL